MREGASVSGVYASNNNNINGMPSIEEEALDIPRDGAALWRTIDGCTTPPSLRRRRKEWQEEFKKRREEEMVRLAQLEVGKHYEEYCDDDGTWMRCVISGYYPQEKKWHYVADDSSADMIDLRAANVSI